MKTFNIANWNKNAHHLAYRKAGAFKEIFPIVILGIDNINVIYTINTDSYIMRHSSMSVSEESLKWDYDDDKIYWECGYKNASTIDIFRSNQYDIFELELEDLTHFI